MSTPAEYTVKTFRPLRGSSYVCRTQQQWGFFNQKDFQVEPFLEAKNS